MAGTPDYGKWIRDALAANPKLSKSGLSRHLRHGLDRSRVLKMISGARRIQIDEIADIAAYLGVDPPSLPIKTGSRSGPEVTHMGTIATGIWHEGEPSPPKGARAVSIPARPDPRWPAEDQGCYEIAIDCPSAGFVAGDYAITYHGRHRHAEGDVVVVQRTRDGLYQLGLARVLGGGTKPSLEPLTGQPPEVGKPVALVIGLFRPLA